MDSFNGRIMWVGIFYFEEILIGMWNGAKTKSMFLFLYPFWGQKKEHDGNGERSNIRRMSGVETKNTHER